MTKPLSTKELELKYKSYIDTLNLEDRDEGVYDGLARHLEASVNHNGKVLDYAGYARLIPPMTHFVIAELLVDVDKRQVAARLDITIEEKRLTEHVFYHYSENGKIDRVWSLVQDGQVTG
jgi:predicted ester cyclase